MDTFGVDAEGLGVLLRAPSREVVERFFETAFRFRHEPARISSTTSASDLRVDSATVNKAAASVVALIRKALYDSAEVKNSEDISKLIPSSVDAKLRVLISTIVFQSLPRWRDGAVDQRVSLPRLDGVSWRVGTASASSDLAMANEPVVSLTLSVRGQPRSSDEAPGCRDVNVTVGAAALGALVESMRRVRDQLGALQG